MRLLACFVCLFLTAAAAFSAIGFDGINGMRNGATSADYVRNWGVPDMFVSSCLPRKTALGKHTCMELWVYCKHGVELIFEDGHVVRQFCFDPKDGDKLILAGAKLNPLEFLNRPTTVAEIKAKYGEPSKSRTSTMADQVLLTLEYYNNDGRKTFGFRNNILCMVSSGFKEGISNPWSEPASINHGKDPSKILGTWRSDYGDVTFKSSAGNSVLVEGSFLPPGNDARFKGAGVISQGSFNKDTGFLKFTLTDEHGLDAHAELFLYPDGKNLNGILHGKNEWDVWQWHMWR